MTCENALREMMDAEPGVLNGARVSELAEHLRSCARCNRVVARLREDERMLGEALAQYAVEPGPEVARSIVARARAAEADAAAKPRVVRSFVTRRWALWVPALAAAALAGVILWPSGPTAVPAAGVATRSQAPPTPRVHPPPGTDVAVLATSNPSITVVWFLEGANK